MEYVICTPKETIELVAYLFAAIFFIMGSALGIVIMKIRNSKRFKRSKKLK